MNYLIGRIDRVWISDDLDPVAEGEIRYLTVAATNPPGASPIMQRTVFPLENWYEAEGNGVNSNFMITHDQAIPLFAIPEQELGDQLLISITVLDDDEVSANVLAGHAILAKVGMAVASYFGGPVVGAGVDKVSSAVQTALKDGGDVDIIGAYTNVLRKADHFGLNPQTHAVTLEGAEGKMRVRYSILRVSTTEEHQQWIVAVDLDEVKMLKDPEGFLEGSAEVYGRVRLATGYQGQDLRQKSINLPTSGTKSVDKGEVFVANRHLYTRHGLPPFLYVEVGIFEDDSSIVNTGTTGDDVLGVLPLMFTHRWLREHPGANLFVYTVNGSDPHEEKVRISLTITVTPVVLTQGDPSDPDGPLA
jgi:hypothetical protein